MVCRKSLHYINQRRLTLSEMCPPSWYLYVISLARRTLQFDITRFLVHVVEFFAIHSKAICVKRPTKIEEASVQKTLGQKLREHLYFSSL